MGVGMGSVRWLSSKRFLLPLKPDDLILILGPMWGKERHLQTVF